jgi:hypothetical protein
MAGRSAGRLRPLESSVEGAALWFGRKSALRWKVFAGIHGTSVRLLSAAELVRVCENGHALPLSADSLD